MWKIVYDKEQLEKTSTCGVRQRKIGCTCVQMDVESCTGTDRRYTIIRGSSVAKKNRSLAPWQTAITKRKGKEVSSLTC
ncbi:unnamed protein product [Callosobruchus maculatus]|uniref:Uncharacterized protein n=1 Tax=Callosobruchus maculatus TaxID=64391 RepID=A0A653DM50_CALMS|nr:unnamed protein product [Callosobruchus maculatus]